MASAAACLPCTSYPCQLTEILCVCLCRTGEQDADAKRAAEAAVSEMAAKLESSKSDLRHAEERLVAAVRARKELQAKLEEVGSARPVGHSTFGVWPPPLAQYAALPSCCHGAVARLVTLTCAIQ